jgi:hypothetical protein
MTTTIGIIIKLVHSGQLLLSASSLYYSYIAITNLQKYEKQTEKAAKVSNTAADQLYKTRTTQGAGAIVVSCSVPLTLNLINGYNKTIKAFNAYCRVLYPFFVLDTSCSPLLT